MRKSENDTLLTLDFPQLICIVKKRPLTFSNITHRIFGINSLFRYLDILKANKVCGFRL